MSKYFCDLKPNIVEGTTYWFWYKEGISSLNSIYPVLYHGFDSTKFSEWISLGIVIFLMIFIMPILYTIGNFYIASRFKKQVVKAVADGKCLEIHNKRNIEYFTMMELLCNEPKE